MFFESEEETLHLTDLGGSGGHASPCNIVVPPCVTRPDESVWIFFGSLRGERVLDPSLNPETVTTHSTNILVKICPCQ